MKPFFSTSHHHVRSLADQQGKTENTRLKRWPPQDVVLCAHPPAHAMTRHCDMPDQAQTQHSPRHGTHLCRHASSHLRRGSPPTRRVVVVSPPERVTSNKEGCRRLTSGEGHLQQGGLSSSHLRRGSPPARRVVVVWGAGGRGGEREGVHHQLRGVGRARWGAGRCP